MQDLLQVGIYKFIKAFQAFDFGFNVCAVNRQAVLYNHFKGDLKVKSVVFYRNV